MTPLTRRAAIYRAKHPRPAIDDDAWLTCWQANNPRPKRYAFSGSGAAIASVLFRACGHEVTD